MRASWILHRKFGVPRERLSNLPSDQTSSKVDEERYSYRDSDTENPKKKRRVEGVPELEHREGETMN